MKKVLIVATVQSHIAQFHKNFIKDLKENGYTVHVAARNNLKEKNGLKLAEPDLVFDIPFSRSPFSFNNFKTYKTLKELINKNKYDIVHCHTPMGGVIARLATKNTNSKVLYTSHGFHFYKGAPLKNWIFYYPVEKFLSKKTDVIFTINLEDYKRAKKKFKKTTVKYIEGVGVSAEKFNNPKEINLYMEFPNIKNPFILTLVGELNDNKNQFFVIKAMKSLVKKNPQIVLALVGNGPNKNKYNKIIDKYRLTDNIKLLGYRTDVPSILNETNLVIGASKREGLPVNIIESMLSKKIVLASKIRGVIDLIEDGKNGYLYDFNNEKEFLNKVNYIVDNYENLDTIRTSAKERSNDFVVERINKKLINIYEIVLKGKE